MPSFAEWCKAMFRRCRMTCVAVFRAARTLISPVVSRIATYFSTRMPAAISRITVALGGHPEAAPDGGRPDAARKSRSKESHRVYVIRRSVALLLVAAATAMVIVLISSVVNGLQAQDPATRIQERSAASSERIRQGAVILKQAAPSPRAEGVLSEGQRSAIMVKAQEVARRSGKTLHGYHYCVSSTGDVGDIKVFESTVFKTLNSSLGWPRAGATFSYAASSGGSACDMTLILAQASAMKSFSDGCSEEYSCRVGNDVIINADRWTSGTPDWLKAGGSVERYRRLVINHEVGHRLGHLDNEASCTVAGGAAPVMQQQSVSLRGCSPNEWPLDSELWIA
ncbi:uncharacterized protein DUF3152 [Bifidobacterium psychraerophilum DSM 22366]|uniref:LysR family transcriptional regulator n=1 Tax=Bifidobacterium psychraerophilum TaxID=218140 RepID=A0A087CFE5_9BIFI|nr:LysR family transcriptional regulator [Bifidobacterium psychraerophilum]PKA94799.1 uncharacterized protein DUF3152 [Bifidobacterium psychraerophilum DSM 22366]